MQQHGSDEGDPGDGEECARPQVQQGDAPLAAQLVDVEAGGVQEEDERQVQRRHRHQRRGAGTELGQAKGTRPEHESQREEEDGQRERGPVDDARGQGGAGEHQREDREPQLHMFHESVLPPPSSIPASCLGRPITHTAGTRTEPTCSTR